MSAFGEVETFGAYLKDSGLALIGIQSNTASQLAISTGDVGPAGNQDTSQAEQDAAAASQLTDIQTSEKQVLDAQNAQLGLPPGGILSAIPSWVWWAAGGLGAVALLVTLAPYAGLASKVKS
ncbi:MAG: hypothetical protein ACRDQZ_26545 [Mycobacteriales bacterium]